MTDAIKSPEAKKLPPLSPQTQAASAIMRKEMSIDKKTHAVEVSQADQLWQKIVPEEKSHLTIALREEIVEQDLLFHAASKHAFGGMCIDFLKDNPTVDEISVSLPLTGRDTLDMVCKHKRDTFTPPKAGEKVKPEDKTVTYGTITSVLNIRAGDNSNKELRAVKEHTKQMAKDLLGG